MRYLLEITLSLDAKIVVLVDIDSIRQENFTQYMYIASTRARTLLYVVEKKGSCN